MFDRRQLYISAALLMLAELLTVAVIAAGR
jgi:hypothetical protein